VSRLLDEADPIPGEYTLEVTSPGLERPLRTPEHFARAVGDVVAVKTRAGVTGDRRIQGVLVAADAQGITIRPGEASAAEPDAADRRLAYDDLERARTVFEWGPAPKPGGAKKAAGPAPTRSSSKKSANQQKAAKR
jgi:ribosome maturation factor RimP